MGNVLVHKHLIIRAEVNNPPKAEEKSMMEEWFVKLIEDINMKLLSGPHIKYVDMPGNKGMTGVCIIETSHIAMHVWDEPDPSLIQLDVYTCGPIHIETVFDALDIFDPVKIEYKFIDRENNLTTVLAGGIVS